MKLKIVLSLLFALVTYLSFGQEETALQTQASKSEISYAPSLFGAVKAKFETTLYDGKHRFNVRNSRIGVKGLVSPNMRYFIQIDFNNEGKLSILDGYAAYMFGDFEVSLGQQQYNFSSDLDRGPTSNIFANRSFLAKFLTTYYSITEENGSVRSTVSSIGSRDIGALFKYRLNSFPLKFSAGLFNGSGANNPDWSNTVNFVARIEAGREKGLGAAVSHYNGNTPVEYRAVLATGGLYENVSYHQKIRMWGGELHYRGDDFLIEAEYAQRRLKYGELHILDAAHIMGYYQFRMNANSTLDYIAPIARWDMGNDIEFMNTKTSKLDKFSAHRATVGVNFGFISKIVGSELRLNFEKYFIKDKPSDFSKNPLLQDKFTIEIVASF